ncbi:MAG: hypothetical protein ACI9VM_000538 [Candidatus Azotimanducaceae bacterium]
MVLSELMVCLKILFVLGLLYSSYIQYANDAWIFIQHANLIFHEAGHVLFIFFGYFLSIAGGTIFEIGIPLLVTGHFL